MRDIYIVKTAKRLFRVKVFACCVTDIRD